MDAKITQGVHINTKLAAQMSLDKQVRVKQDEAQITLPVVIDERVPDNSVLIYAGQVANQALDTWHGLIELTN